MRNVASSDYMQPPEIISIVLRFFPAPLADMVYIDAADTVEVTSVHVVLREADGSLVEEGEAEHVSDGALWWFAAKRDLRGVLPLTIQVAARDRAGNTTTRTEVKG